MSNQYDNYLTRFKKQLWDKCVEQNIFNNIPENNFDNVKKTFEYIITNYQAQILQNENNTKSNFSEILLSDIKRQIEKFKLITKDEIQEMNNNEFNKEYAQKQKEFDELNNKNVPEQPNFSDNIEEEPLDNSNIDALIQEQIKQRENILKLNDLSNNIVQNNNNIIENNLTSNNINSLPQLSLETNKMIEMNKIDEIKKILLVQNKILEQIVQSQISILKKIR
tara:strand:- start:180 stop:848 length:669 start_codon:yes stop_codon:yes gene_type:complete